MKKLILFVASLLFGTNTIAQTILFSCNAEKHMVLISQADPNTYLYRSWNKPKPITDKPDMELKSSNMESVGSCQRYYKFKSGKFEFEVTNQWSCQGPGEIPPTAAKDAIGDLYVKSGGELKAHYYCYR